MASSLPPLPPPYYVRLWTNRIFNVVLLVGLSYISPTFKAYVAIPLVVGVVVFAIYARLHALVFSCDDVNTPQHPREPPKKHIRIAVIGTGISGIQAIKQCVADGLDVVAFEQQGEVGGLWRYKEEMNMKYPSVYASTHIDTGRDLNSFGDLPFSRDKPLCIHNRDVFEYLKRNVDELDLRSRIRFHTTVKRVEVDDESAKTWRVHVESDGHERTELFDGVMVCTGRHNTPYTPDFAGLSSFGGLKLHSAAYKDPKRHGLAGKRVLVIGIGNSGCDIVTEVAEVAEHTWLCARSGSWVFDMRGQALNQLGEGPRFLANLLHRLPWRWVQSVMKQKVDEGMLGDQQQLFEHGLEPDYGPLQAHPTATGLHNVGSNFFDQLRAWRITVRRTIRRFTPSGVVFVVRDSDTGAEREEEVALDCVIFGTGFKQAVDFIDPKVVDLRPERAENIVPLWLGMFATDNHLDTIAFINFVQSASFMCADLQSRVFTAHMRGDITLPPPSVRRAQTRWLKATMADRYVQRPRHNIQEGLQLQFYDHLAEMIGSYPSLWRLIIERPEAVYYAWWHPVVSMHYRLVGPGRTKLAVEQLRERVHEIGFRPLEDNVPMLLKLLFIGTLVAKAAVQGYSVLSRKPWKAEFVDQAEDLEDKKRD